jgi:hypothetical protein
LNDANNNLNVSNCIKQIAATPVVNNDTFTLVHYGLNPVTVVAPGVLGNDIDTAGTH